MAIETETRVARGTGRGLLWAGLGLILLAIALVVVQYAVLKWLTPPWHVPILLTLGAVFLVLAVARRRTVVRIGLVLLAVALAGFQWFFMLSLSRLPSYEGPAQAGQPIPAFQTKFADGRQYVSSRDLDCHG